MDQTVVVITGASSGIGAAAAARLARDGLTVGLVARRREALDAVAATCGGRAHVFPGDMGVREDVRRVAGDVLGTLGRIDVWINNAGRGISRLPSELTDEDVDDMMRVNVKSALYGMQEVLPHFKARNAGHFINVSSMLGRVPLATIRSAYCGAKHFLDALTAMMRDEVSQTHPGIQISLVSPGVVRTEFGLNARHGGADSRQLPGSQSAEDVADVIAGVVASRQPDVYTRAGSQKRVADYYAHIGVDPA